MTTVAEPGRQALKARQTRERIINAVIELITEGGYGAASSSRIARRAGVTWGAVQHHFGSKDDILAAVLERSHQHFTALMEDERLTQGELDRRVQLFVDRFWQHYQSDLYLAALEILLATRQQADRGIDTAALVAQQSQSHLATMKRIFSDSPCSDEQYLAALILVHTFLTGLTIGRVFEHGRDSEECSLERVKALLQDMLRGEGC